MRHGTGYSLLVVLVLMAVGGFGLQQLTTNKQLAHQLTLEQQVRQNQVLDHIKASLLGFAGSQGVHSQSHLGHLPCPADLPERPPKTTCLNKPWGYLPVHSSTSINYLNLGLNARHNEIETSGQRYWHYAVSAQLLQANALGWSRWVDYSKPSIRVRIKTDHHRVHSNVAAVVAAKIERLGEHEYEVTGPYLLISVPELQRQMNAVQKHQLRDALVTWTLQRVSQGQAVEAHENLSRIPASMNRYAPIDSNCSCRCTKTRCTCQCDQAGDWISSGSCVGNNPECVEHAGHTECRSSAEEACVMSGPSRMKSAWPVSRFEPVAAANKSCRPASRTECPLAKDNTACTCDFSWPENVKTDLSNFQVRVDGFSNITVMQAQP
jgi:hypothetical protein